MNLLLNKLNIVQQARTNHKYTQARKRRIRLGPPLVGLVVIVKSSRNPEIAPRTYPAVLWPLRGFTSGSSICSFMLSPIEAEKA